MNNILTDAINNAVATETVSEILTAPITEQGVPHD